MSAPSNASPQLAMRLRLRTLVDRAAHAAETTYAEVVSPDRQARLARVRFAISWVASTRLAASADEIGEALGSRHRASIHNARRRAEQLRAADPAFRAMTDTLAAATAEPRR